MDWGPTKETLNLGTQWPFGSPGKKKLFDVRGKTQSKTSQYIVIYRATQYKVCACELLPVFLSCGGACISLVLPPAMWPAVDSCACA